MMKQVDLKNLKEGMKVALRNKTRRTVSCIISSDDKTFFRISFEGYILTVDYNVNGSAEGGCAGTHDIVKILG